MLEQKVFLMAQGHMKRLAPVLSFPKHHLKVGNETIIGRTLRLLQERGMKDVTVIAPDIPVWIEFMKGFPEATMATLSEVSPTVASGVFRTRHLWPQGKSIVALLADTVFSQKTLDLILGSNAIYEIYTRSTNPWTKKKWPEYYGLKIRSDGRPLYEAAASIHENAGDKHYNIPVITRRIPQASIVSIDDDWTDDIDFPEELPNLDLLARLAREEEEGRKA